MPADRGRGACQRIRRKRSSPTLRGGPLGPVGLLVPGRQDKFNEVRHPPPRPHAPTPPPSRPRRPPPPPLSPPPPPSLSFPPRPGGGALGGWWGCRCRGGKTSPRRCAP